MIWIIISNKSRLIVVLVLFLLKHIEICYWLSITRHWAVSNLKGCNILSALFAFVLLKQKQICRCKVLNIFISSAFFLQINQESILKILKFLLKCLIQGLFEYCLPFYILLYNIFTVDIPHGIWFNINLI